MFFLVGEKILAHWETDGSKDPKLELLIRPILLQDYRFQANRRKYMSLRRAGKGSLQVEQFLSFTYGRDSTLLQNNVITVCAILETF